MNFEKFFSWSNKNRKDTFAERMERAIAIHESLKDKFGLDVVVLRSDSPIKGTVGYVLADIKSKPETVVPIDIPIASPVKEKIDLSNMENLKKKYNELVKDDYLMYPYITAKKIGIVVSYNSKRVLYFVNTKKGEEMEKIEFKSWKDIDKTAWRYDHKNLPIGQKWGCTVSANLITNCEGKELYIHREMSDYIIAVIDALNKRDVAMAELRKEV